MKAKTRERIYWNDNWGFAKEFTEAMTAADYPQDLLDTVRLPHTTVELPFHYFDESLYQGICGYRKVFVPEETWQGKCVILTVEAAAHKADVILNGEHLLTHNSGYTAFEIDLAPFLKWHEENILVIKVDSHETLNIPPFGHVIDYMTFSGLYREVYLDICPQKHIKDVFAKVSQVQPSADGIRGKAVLASEITLEGIAQGKICQALLTREGEKLIDFPAQEVVHQLEDIQLWSPESPALYLLQTSLYDGETLLDTHTVTIGIREISFLADGLYINGQKQKLRGLNRHQSFPYVGYAMPRSMQRKDAEILKEELCVNAVRTSHYPQSHHFLERCDELGLLVFTEIPGWQHLGDEAWKAQAVKNTEEMVLQYRNHPSIFLWGVRINESMDDDELYSKTNAAAHALDSTRPTSGVRYIQKSSLLEDVYAYNDFSHDGGNGGCLKKKSVTPDVQKGYLISECNGHMFPTKSFDNEDHRVEHLLRHARVMDAWYGEEDIAGGFEWCMFDYNTHKDFGSGDRICYHGVTDMFRNHKLAAALYSAQSDEKPFLEISSAMDIGEHPGCLMKDVYAITNADSVRVYKNENYIGEFTRKSHVFANLPHAPILIDDFIGEVMEKTEGFSHKKAEDIKKVLLAANKYGLANLPLNIKLLAAKCMLLYKMSMDDAVTLYNKYVGNWGGTSTTYRFEAIKNGAVAAVSEKKTMKEAHIEANVSHTLLVEDTSYDVASVRIQAVSEKGNQLVYFQEPLRLETAGEIELIGPPMISLKGGMGGTYVKTTGKAGTGLLRIIGNDVPTVEIRFEIKILNKKY